MTRNLFRARAVAAAGGLMLAVSLGAAAAPASAAPAAPDAASALPAGVTTACPQTGTAGQATCDSLVSTATASSPLEYTYSPQDLESAYDLQVMFAGSVSTQGMLQTVAVIGAGDDPTVSADLNEYRSEYGLPACTTTDGCLTVVDQSDGTQDPGYTSQIAISLDMVSAACPNCHLLLVQAANNTIPSLLTAVDTAVADGASIINEPYTGPEFNGETSDDAQYLANLPGGVEITVPAGNDPPYGYAGSGGEASTQYPAASPYVTSVGGTNLDQAGTSACTTAEGGVRGWCEEAWSGTISGCSQDEPAPVWQSTATGCSGFRADNDVAAVASSTQSPGDPMSYYYDGSWGATGATGTASAIVAGIYADGGTPAAAASCDPTVSAAGCAAAYPYEYPGGPQPNYTTPGVAYPYFSGLNPITSGTNAGSVDGAPDPCTGTITDLCQAGPGWNGITGVGSPAGTGSFTAGGTSEGAIYNGISDDYCLDNHHSDLANNNEIDVWGCDGGADSQTWSYNASGSVEVGTTGYCLDIKDDNTASGSLALLYTCTGHTDQDWRVTALGQLVEQNSGKCLTIQSSDEAEEQLEIEPCALPGPEYQLQQWVTPYSQPVRSGEISSQDYTGSCIDNYHSNLTAGNVIDIYTCDGGTDSQEWTMAANGSITIDGGKWCLDGSGTANNGNNLATELEACDADNDGLQLWIPLSNGALFSPYADAVIEATSGTNLTQLQLDNADGDSDQSWSWPS
jgi:hypothetical protein